MKAFHGKQEVKDFYVARLQEHHRLDQIIQGIGWEEGRGCNVGCILHEYNHAKYPEELGLPEWYARLCDTIFEGLPTDKASDFAMSSLTSISVGADIENVKWRIAILRHEKQLIYVKDEKVRNALHLVIQYCKDMIAGSATEEQREKALCTVRSAACSVSRSAAWSAESAAESAADSAEWSA